jgi:hypothetical protein
MFQPVTVGAWTFDGVHHCPSLDSPYCAAADLSQWARRQYLTPGAEGMLQGNRGGDLDLDSTDSDATDDNPTPPTTREYGVSQLSGNPNTPDPAWHNAPVVVSDQSFTASVWVAPNDTTTTMTAVSQSGTQRAAFTLGLRTYPTGTGTVSRWSFTMTAADTTAAGTADASSTDPVTDDAVGSWTHLVGVYDATTARLSLYVNGEPAGTSAVPATWNAAGPLTVGADLTGAAYGDLWLGGIDDLDVFQGNMTPAQVAQLYGSQEQPDAAA